MQLTIYLLLRLYLICLDGFAVAVGDLWNHASLAERREVEMLQREWHDRRAKYQVCVNDGVGMTVSL